MGSQVAAAAGLLFTHPTFTDYVVVDWKPAAAGEQTKHKDANGNSFASSLVDDGTLVTAVLAVKSGEAVPVQNSVLTGTYPDTTTLKFVVNSVDPFREGALTYCNVTLEYRASMPNPA